jgi:PTH1 family peptidyl-tRNA hydrolase
MKVVLAQGNPGRKYHLTRHNLGFLVLDFLAKTRNLTWQDSSRFQSNIIKYKSSSGEQVLLVKPQTFYNLTGPVAQKLVSFYKLDPSEDLLVVCDDLHLDFGALRLRKKGSDGGNNGLKSIASYLGEDYHRLRLGIAWSSFGDFSDTDFVLSRFSPDELTELPDILDKAGKIIDDFLLETN